jgi:phosphotransferase system enzyme I (PtsI)/phosphotransferase system enzyme I (PtsP)
MTTKAKLNALASLTQIIQSAAHASSIEDQVQHIVDRISDVLSVDVCTLYRRLDDDSMSLVASHGLVRTHPIIIPPRRGLVGQVVISQHSLNIAEPDKHPDYFYVANSKEEEFHSFCGVPLINSGMVNGVLVVQSRRSRTLDSEQEALLSTLAIHLALMLKSISVSPHEVHSENRVYRGISGAQGIAVGKAFTQYHPFISQAQVMRVEDIPAEMSRWRSVRQTAIDELIREREIVQREMGEGLASVLDAYQMMLQDDGFDQRILSEISEGFHLPWALKKTVEFFSEQFKALDDPYLRSRHEDIEHLGDKLYQIWQGKSGHEIPSGGEPLILIGDRISISTITNLAMKKLHGIVCFEGASLSHIALFANALGIPAVMGTGDLAINNGDILIVDGESAEVICCPSETLLREYRSLIRERKLITARLLSDSHIPAVTTDNVRISLLANSGLQADVEPGLRHGAEGIGLYRTEIPFMISAKLPSEQDQESIYRSVFDLYPDKPVYLRTLDIGSDKPLPYLPAIREDNPALGLRGIRYTLDNLSLITTQLRAVMKSAGKTTQLHLLLPMISTTEQLDRCIELIDDVVQELKTEGFDIRRPSLGIMVEIPSCISMLPFWRNKIDFVSIGTNDLSQYLLATDRNNPMVGKWFDALHPSVLSEMVRVTEIAVGSGLPVSVCGEMASDPVAVVYLIGMGIRQLSMSAVKIPLIKSLIREISQADAARLLSTAMTLDSGKAIRQLGISFLDSHDLSYKELLIGTDKAT